MFKENIPTKRVIAVVVGSIVAIAAKIAYNAFEFFVINSPETVAAEYYEGVVQAAFIAEVFDMGLMLLLLPAAIFAYSVGSAAPESSNTEAFAPGLLVAFGVSAILRALGSLRENLHFWYELRYSGRTDPDNTLFMTVLDSLDGFIVEGLVFYLVGALPAIIVFILTTRVVERY